MDGFRLTLVALIAAAFAPAPSLAARAKSVQEAATVNVNTAQQSELQATRGFDKLTAKQVIEYRNRHGFYRSLGDLEKALGSDAAEKVAPHVAFDGPPYVPPPKAAKSAKKK